MFVKVKNNYEKIAMKEYKFTTTWVGAYIAEVSDYVADNVINWRKFKM